MKKDSVKTWTDEMIKAATDAALINFGGESGDSEAFAQASSPFQQSRYKWFVNEFRLEATPAL